MHTPAPLTRTPAPLARTLAPLALAASLAACSAPTAPTGPDAPGEETPPQTVTVYDVAVTSRYIDIVGSCDTNAFGTPSAGEFQYRVVVRHVDLSEQNSHESRGYNSVTGSNHQRAAGGRIDFADRTFRWSGLPSDGNVRIELRGSEWDGPVKDRDMNDRANSERVPFATSRTDGRLTVGADSSCRMRLQYSVEWTPRAVEVG